MSTAAFTEVLELQREFNAPIERVFSAWTHAEYLAQWFGPEHFSVCHATLDCRPQGKYDIQLESPDKKIIRHYGEYLVVDEPHQLVFTWELEDQACQGSEGQHGNTLVEINFKALGDRTLLLLKHEKLPDQGALDGHRYGWSASLENLENYLLQD